MPALRGFDDVERLVYAAGQARRADGLLLDLSNTAPVYPNGAVPFAAAYSYLVNEEHLPIKIVGESEMVRSSHVLNPIAASALTDDAARATNVVWEYKNETEANRLTNRFTRAIEENVRCETGVIDALTWCLYEVMDNVFQHSKAPSGFVMMQIHAKTRRCAITVSDTGIGVHKSFIDGGVYPAQDAYEALKNAVQERVTSKTKNMGNGLFGLIRVVGLNGGLLNIRSGRGHLSFAEDRLSGDAKFSRRVLEPNDHQGTTVDWQLDMAQSVTLAAALNVPDPDTPRIEKLEDDDGEHRLDVADFEDQLGSRGTATNIRLRLGNLLADGVPRIVLDFSGIGVVSSSFADEVLGKMALELGLMEFMRVFRFDGMNPTIRGIVDRAITQRITEGDDHFPGTP